MTDAAQRDMDHLTELSALYEISSIPTSLVSEEELARLALDKVTHLLGARLALFYVWEEGAETPRLLASRGLGRADRERLASPFTEDPARLAESGTLLLEGPEEVAAHLPLGPEFGVRSGLCTSIAVQGRPAALLYALRLSERPFSRAEVALFDVLASRVGTALQTVRLFAESERSRRELQDEVAERRRVEEALRESEERFALALRGADLGLWDWEVPTGRVTFNARWAEIIGCQPDQVTPHVDFWRERVHEDDLPRAIAAMQAHLEGQAPQYESEHRLRSATSDWVWVLERGQVVSRDPEGRPLRATGTTLDITARKRAEEDRLALERRMLQAQRLESLGVLAGGIAHDFNNLLMAMLGNLGLALREVSSSSPAGVCIQEAEQAARRAAELTRQMLAYSGKGRFVVGPLDLTSLVSEMTPLLRTSISKAATLNLRLAEDLPPVMADAGQFQQVVMNLVVNASEALGERAGGITIATGEQYCDETYLTRSRLQELRKPGRYAYLEVSDTGCGIAREEQERLFEPFYTTKFAGRGLGLAAVLGIVRAHQGAIMVYSEPGVGTTFKVLIPACDGETAAPAPANEASEASELQGTVLLVDDEEAVRRVCRRMLEHLGLSVVIATHGQEAIDRLREHGQAISCVLLDLTMPLMDGVETYRHLRQIVPDIKVVLSSGYSHQAATERFAGKGLAGFIQKPYQLATLRRVLGEVLRP